MSAAELAAPAAAIAFRDSKEWVIAALELSRDALHIHVGLALYLTLLLLARRWLAGWGIWLLVLALTLLGEVADYLVLRQGGLAFHPAVHLHDLWNTMFWPTVLAALASCGVTWRRRPFESGTGESGMGGETPAPDTVGGRPRSG